MRRKGAGYHTINIIIEYAVEIMLHLKMLNGNDTTLVDSGEQARKP